MLLLLARPGVVAPPGAEVIDLAPLGPGEARRIVEEYVDPVDVVEVTEQLLAAGPGWPGRLHEEGDLGTRRRRPAAWWRPWIGSGSRASG